MEPVPQAGGAYHRGVRRTPRIWPIAVGAAALIVLVVLPLSAVANRPAGGGTVPAGAGQETLPTLRPSVAPRQTRSVSIDFGIVTDPDTDWADVDAHLDQAHANTVNLNAGRVEFTAFDWPEHPQFAAEPGTDHLAVAAKALNTLPDGGVRQVNLIVDAFVPTMIAADPSLAGVNAKGVASLHSPSAYQIAKGRIGDLLVAYITALAQRYRPGEIEVTELFLDNYTFGADDLTLFASMTGARDWPRDAGGGIDAHAPAIAAWRSAVVTGFMTRVRQALDAAGEAAVGLSLDVRVNWDDPAAGRPFSGHDYAQLLRAGIRPQLWVYVGQTYSQRPTGVEQLTASLKAGGYEMSRFILSVGLWKGTEGTERISAAEFAEALKGAATNGITAVNATPYSLMTPSHWTALASAWA